MIYIMLVFSFLFVNTIFVLQIYFQLQYLIVLHWIQFVWICHGSFAKSA